MAKSSFPEQNGQARHDSDHSYKESRDINGGSRRKKAGSTLMIMVASLRHDDGDDSIGDHHR